MPRHLTNAERARAIAKLEENWSLSRVAADLNVSKSCIFKIKKQWEQGRALERQPRIGVGRVSNELQDNAVVQFVQANPFSTAVQAKIETHFPGSIRTVRKRLNAAGLKNRAAARKVFLSDENKERRVQLANNFLNENDDFWNSTVFSDEKIFQSYTSGRLRVYRPENSRFNEEYVHPLRSSGHFSVNVWGWISVHGPGACYRINGRLTADNYINILQNVMLPTVREVYPDRFTFQQDNCPVHTARVVRQWFEVNNINVLPWPPRSPDLNPIENVWGYLTKKMYTRDFRPNNEDELWNMIQNAWEELREDYDMRVLINSMRNRLESVVAVNGAAIKY